MRFSSRGKRKYQCRDCKGTQMVHWRELNRASQPRCISCGGFLDPFSEGAREDRVIGDLNVREHTASRGSIVKASHMRDGHTHH